VFLSENYPGENMITDQQKYIIEKQLLSILLILALFGLAAIIFQSTFTRLWADDFCVASTAKSMSFSEYFKHWYLGWTGRYSSIIFQGLSALLGVKFVALLPTFIIVIWCLSLVWSIFPIVRFLDHPAPFLAAFTYSGIFLLFLFNSIPNLFESVFWNIGAISYSLPLVGFTIIVGILMRVCLHILTGWGWVFPVILLTIIVGGLSEVFIAMLITIYTLAILSILLIRNPKARKTIWFYMITGLFSAILALMIVWIAPGNALRQASTSQGQPTTLILLPKVILRSTLIIFYEFLIYSRWWILSIVFTPFLLSFLTFHNQRITVFQSNSIKELYDQKWFKGILLVGLFVIIISIAAATPSSYIQGEYPTRRAMILPFYFIIIGIMVIMSLLGSAVRNFPSINILMEKKPKINYLVFILVIIMIAAGVATVIGQTINSLPDNISYAQLWDQRDQELIILAEDGVQDIYIYSLKGEPSDNPEYWVNRCMAEYYGVQTISDK
jgi:hypothetical protein